MKFTEENYTQLDALFQRLFEDYINPHIGSGVNVDSCVEVFFENVGIEDLVGAGLDLPHDEDEVDEIFNDLAHAFANVALDSKYGEMKSCKPFLPVILRCCKN